MQLATERGTTEPVRLAHLRPVVTRVRVPAPSQSPREWNLRLAMEQKLGIVMMVMMVCVVVSQVVVVVVVVVVAMVPPPAHSQAQYAAPCQCTQQ